MRHYCVEQCKKLLTDQFTRRYNENCLSGERRPSPANLLVRTYSKFRSNAGENFKENVVNLQTFFKTAVLGTVMAAAAGAVSAQSTDTYGGFSKPFSVAERNNVYCAGYVQSSAIATDNRLVGAVEEQEQFNYSQNNLVYVNMGANKGVKVGDVMSVVRPRGKVATRWTRKDSLGFLVQEVGTVEIVSVKAEVSAARVKTSCDSMMLGDLVQPFQARVSPRFEQRASLDLFRDPNGKAVGRLFMARDGQEMISREQIIYVDLGAEDNVKPGDYLTIFRPLGKGHLFISDEKESVSARDEGFQSREYRGGKFSNQAARKSGDHAGGRVVTTEKAKKDRPSDIRKIVGEAVILNVKERTATAVIVRTAQEIHTGDWVEVQ